MLNNQLNQKELSHLRKSISFCGQCNLGCQAVAISTPGCISLSPLYNGLHESPSTAYIWDIALKSIRLSNDNVSKLGNAEIINVTLNYSKSDENVLFENLFIL